MDLYFMPMACSFAAYVTCLEADIKPTLRRVDRLTKTYDDGRDYLAIAPKGTVPALDIGDTTLLTESAAVLQYLADRSPGAQLAPPPGTPERYRLVEWLNFTASELHKKHLEAVFSRHTLDAHKAWAREQAPKTLAFVNAHLAARTYLVGDRFTVADAYMFWALLVAPHGGMPLDAFPHLAAYVARIRERPSVRTALAHDYPLYMQQPI